MENFENIRLPWTDWKIVKYLGGGAYGKVYEIERNISGMQERAALKIVSRPKDESEIESYYNEGYSKAELIASYESEIRNYVQEYKLMKELQGESNIVSCDDFTMIPHDDGIGGDIFIRMELLTSLQQKMRERNLSEQEIIRLGKDISHALVLCESKNIIHRDIKPANIMVSQFGNYKLGDFGVSKIMDHETYATAMGTPDYQAPEVVHMERYGQAADIYSLGITLYWLLNNRKMPFIGADEQQTPILKDEAMKKRYRGEVLPAPKNGSTKLKEIVLKACAYRPEDRYASAQEMYDELFLLENGNVVTGKASVTTDTIKPENGLELEKDEHQEEGTIGGAVADSGWNTDRKTQGNSWGEKTGTIGKPRKIGKKSSAGQSGFQHSTVKNGFKVTVQNDFREEEKEKRSGAGRSGFQRSTVKNGFKVTVQDDLRTEEQEEFSAETIGVKNVNPKNNKTNEVEHLLSRIEVEKITIKNVIDTLVIGGIVGGLGVGAFVVGAWPLGVFWCLMGLGIILNPGHSDFSDWIKENQKQIKDFDFQIKVNPEFAKRLYYEKCPKKRLLKYIEERNPDVAKEIKDSKK
ncbi:MAG: serine/threonine protein kinase [Coprococcus comes]|nr:serine/threonine protein kinase [Coprococcus comes]